MKKIIHCPHCDRQMSVDSKFAGRRLNCPVCGVEMKIPNFEQTSSDGEPIEDEPLTNAKEDETKSDEALHERPDDLHASDLADFDWKRLEFPQVEPDDPMLKFFPAFQPNPFAVSYPLNVKTEADVVNEHDEEEEFVNSKMPSVDELIN